jgi:hypothetical protein
MKKKEPEYSCGLEASLDVVGGKWKVLILWPLHPEPRRFGELRREVKGVSEKMLIQQLRELEADGIVARKDFHESTSTGRILPDRVGSVVEDGAGTALCVGRAAHGEDQGRKEQEAGECQIGSPLKPCE